MFGGMKVLLGLGAVLTLSGCVLALPTYNRPSQEKVLVRGRTQGAYSIHIDTEDGGDFPVSPDGRVLLDVPTLPRFCSLIFLVFPLTDGRPESQKVFQVLRDGHVVKTLSLRQLRRLRVDEAGYHRLELK